MLKAAGEAKAVNRTRVGELSRAADAPKEPLARRSGTEALGAWGALACIGLQGRRRSSAGSEGNLAGAGASGATKGFGGRRTGAVVGGLLTETAVKRMSCSRSSSFVPQWTSPSRGRSTWCPLLLRWKARMHVSVCCCCARAWLWRRSRCGGAHFWVVFASQDAKLAGSLRFVGRKMQFHQNGLAIRAFWQPRGSAAGRSLPSRDFAPLSVSLASHALSHALVPRRTRCRPRRTRSSEPPAHPRRVPCSPACPPR